MDNKERFIARILRFGLMKRLRRGTKVKIIPSYKCTHTCSYCSLLVDGVYPYKDILLPLEDWKNFLEKYDAVHKKEFKGLREVVITGGEPTILPYFKELVEWILFEKKWFVTIFSNLSTLTLKDVRPSRRLRIGATFHHSQQTVEEFHQNYIILNKIHRVDVCEFGKAKLPYSKTKEILKEDQIINLLGSSIRVEPDLSMYLTCRGGVENFI